MVTANKARNVEYIDFSPQYLDEMVKLGEKRFGEMYTNKDKLLSYVTNKNNICKLAIDKDENRLLGFFLTHASSIKGVSEEFKLSEEELKNVVGGHNNLCVARSLVLQQDAEKAGLATELVKKGMQKAKDMGFHSAWSPLWIRKDGSIPAKKVIERNNFKFSNIITHMLWFDDKDYKCLDCHGPCKCDAAIYYKIL